MVSFQHLRGRLDAYQTHRWQLLSVDPVVQQNDECCSSNRNGQNNCRGAKEYAGTPPSFRLIRHSLLVAAVCTVIPEKNFAA